MTITSTAPITLTDVMNELRIVNPGRAYPIALGDADVRALAGIASGPISLGDLKGKTSYIAPSGVGVNASASFTSGLGAGTASCNPSVTPSGTGTPFTYAWSFTSNPNGCTLGSAASQTCSVSKAFGFNTSGTANATLQVVITDTSAATATVGGITAHLDWAP